SRPSRPRDRARHESATSSVASTSPSRSNQAIVATALRLHVEADLEDVAVLDLVVLALDAQSAEVARLGPAADLEQLVPVDDLGPDEAPLHVGVDAPGALGGLG